VRDKDADVILSIGLSILTATRRSAGGFQGVRNGYSSWSVADAQARDRRGGMKREAPALITCLQNRVARALRSRAQTPQLGPPNAIQLPMLS